MSGKFRAYLFALCATFSILLWAYPTWGGPLYPGMGNSKSRADTTNEADVTTPVTEVSFPGDVEKVVAHLSDERVRELLIKTLMEEARRRNLKGTGQESTLINTVDSFLSLASFRIKFVLSQIKNLPKELREIPDRFLGREKVSSWLRKLIIALFIFLPGFGFHIWVHKRLSPIRDHFESVEVVDVGDRFVAAIFRMIPEVLSLLLFTVFSVGLFFLIFGTGHQPVRVVFLAVVITVVIARLLIIISEVICSPSVPALRLLNVSEEAAIELYRVLCRLSWLVSVLIVLTIVSKRLFVSPDIAVLMILLFGTIFLAAIGWEVWNHRYRISEAILESDTSDSRAISWFKMQIAKTWHIFALAYLFLVWVVWAVRLVVYDTKFDGAFFISLLIVPMFFALDRIGQWVVNAALGTLAVPDDSNSRKETETQKGDASEDQESDFGEKDLEEGKVGEKRENRLLKLSRMAVRLIIFFTMFLWLLDLWGFESTFGKTLTKSAFHILLIITMALVFWRWLSSYIAKKLEETLPEEKDSVEDEGEEEEWRTVALGRRHTLLPLLRKFAGTMIMVMTVLLVLSSLGINIGPLLAGAGVVGLAISFGAQKLVSDILCGIFYLIDDAFRIGEYIQAGSVSGTVEGMTLRNVMLRHHRGMLQIVPFSDLGSITNFMRGGIVVKFNLKLPYDTDIDKVRKIIKKVGKKMLEDPELGPYFIKPIKSQGVREVGDSALTFRVKFTAKPGKQFLIRREAYRRITEALKAAGIEYAHPKVIVEIPNLPEFQNTTKEENSQKESETPMQKAQIIQEAGAAAGFVVERQKKKQPGEKSEDDPFLDL